MEPIAPELWLVETPLRFRGIEVGRRMTVIRLASGSLLIHSPAPLTAELRDALAQLGEVRFVVPASSMHGHLFMEEYQAAYPAAELFSAPGLDRKRKDLALAGLLGSAPRPMRAVARATGAYDHARPTPMFRLGLRNRIAARRSLDRVLSWDFDRIILGHGEPMDTGGPSALRDAYAWLR